MAKNHKDWLSLGTHGWDSRDWGQAGMVAGGALAGLLTGGLSYGWTAASMAAGAGIGATVGGLTAIQDQAAEDTERKNEKAVARAEAKEIENEIMRKSSLLAAQNTMTAREAMARNINAAIKNMYRPKTAGNNPNPYVLGGDEQDLG